MYTLALHPEVMKKAQEEVDRVVGDKRLPNFEDEGELVYVRALVKEVLRWKPPTETSIPHATVEVRFVSCLLSIPSE
jgi:cytochrome P450